MVLYLIRHGADLRPDANGWSAHVGATQAGRTEVVRLLDSIAHAGGWRKYVGERRRRHCCRIRQSLSTTYQTLHEGAPDRRLLHFVYGRNRDDEGEAAAAAAAREASIRAMSKRRLKALALRLGVTLPGGAFDKSYFVDSILAVLREEGERPMLTVPSDVFAHIVPYLES